MQAIRHGTMLPSLQRNEIGPSELEPFSQLNTWPVVSPVNASRRPSRDAAHHSGSGRMASPYPMGGLSPPILCQLSWRTLSWVKRYDAVESHSTVMSATPAKANMVPQPNTV